MIKKSYVECEHYFCSQEKINAEVTREYLIGPDGKKRFIKTHCLQQLYCKRFGDQCELNKK
jgi:hypothetical protein